jgi:hypothetical protein
VIPVTPVHFPRRRFCTTVAMWQVRQVSCSVFLFVTELAGRVHVRVCALIDIKILRDARHYFFSSQHLTLLTLDRVGSGMVIALFDTLE